MKKKILFVVQLPPPTHGASVMNKLVVESPEINDKFDCQTLPLFFSRDVNTLGKFTFAKLLKLISYCLRLVFLAITWRPDAIYFNLCPVGSIFYRDLVFSTFLRVLPGRTVYHLHVKGIQDEVKVSPWKRKLYQFVFRRTNVVCLSSALSEDATGYGANLHVVHNGIGVVDISRDGHLRISAGRTEHPCRILFLSNFIRSKGIENFLLSMKLLNDRGVPFEASVVGSEGDLSQTEVANLIMACGLDDKVKLHGPLYGDDKAQQFMRSSIFVFPTYYSMECFPLVLLEAMQFSLPIVSSYEGAIPEIVEEGFNGFLVDPKDISALADRVATLITDVQLRHAMGLNGWNKFYEMYTLEKFERNMCEVFNGVTLEPTVQQK